MHNSCAPYDPHPCDTAFTVFKKCTAINNTITFKKKQIKKKRYFKKQRTSSDICWRFLPSANIGWSSFKSLVVAFSFMTQLFMAYKLRLAKNTIFFHKMARFIWIPPSVGETRPVATGGLSGAVPPNFVAPRKFCSKHIAKAKIVPP